MKMKTNNNELTINDFNRIGNVMKSMVPFIIGVINKDKTKYAKLIQHSCDYEFDIEDIKEIRKISSDAYGAFTEYCMKTIASNGLEFIPKLIRKFYSDEFNFEDEKPTVNLEDDVKIIGRTEPKNIVKTIVNTDQTTSHRTNFFVEQPVSQSQEQENKKARKSYKCGTKSRIEEDYDQDLFIFNPSRYKFNKFIEGQNLKDVQKIRVLVRNTGGLEYDKIPPAYFILDHTLKTKEKKAMKHTARSTYNKCIKHMFKEAADEFKKTYDIDHQSQITPASLASLNNRRYKKLGKIIK